MPPSTLRYCCNCRTERDFVYNVVIGHSECKECGCRKAMRSRPANSVPISSKWVNAEDPDIPMADKVADALEPPAETPTPELMVYLKKRGVKLDGRKNA